MRNEERKRIPGLELPRTAVPGRPPRMSVRLSHAFQEGCIAMRKRTPAFTLAVLLGLTATTTVARVFDLGWFTINGGGVMRSAGPPGADFELSGTIGQADAGEFTSTGDDFTLTGGFWFPLVPGDANADGGVNLDDYKVFEGCMTGPDGGPPEGVCQVLDADGNGTIDLGDFAAMQSSFSGP